jgi:molecular chaperone DnaK (HSP70)
VPQIEVTFDIDANGTGSSFGRAVVKRKKMEIYKDFIWDDCGIW